MAFFHPFSSPSDLNDANEKRIVQEFSSSPLKDDNCPTENQSLTVYFYVEYAQKLKEFKHLLCKVGEDPLEGLNMIDAVVRLGVDYHFQEEIEAILQSQRQYFISTVHDNCDYNLHEVALRFRLLRQQGYHVSADVFEKFKDNRDGKFKSNLGEDMKGLMELYEASQVSIEGEDILDEARDFSRQLLQSWAKNLDHHRASVVLNTLEHPHHKSLRSFLAKDFLNNFQGTKGWINVLKELTEMDFKKVKYVHQEDILQVSKWWKDLGLAKELKFVRDQPLKWYIWTMGCLTDPSLSEQRVELTKPVSLVYIIDDIFDIYGTLDELTLFTEAVNRWEFAAAEGLPEYLKICFKALYATTNEISYKIYKKHGWNPIDSLQKAWGRLCNAFLEEAQWFAFGNLPKTEEYLKNAVLSTGIHVVLVHMFFLLGQGITKETVDLLDDIPSIIYYTATILRLWDDLGSAKDENQNGNDGSYIECYMKDNQGCSVEDAQKHVIQMISDASKRLNQSCLSPNPFPASFIKASLNAARMVPLMYNYKDNRQLQSLMDHMKSIAAL